MEREERAKADREAVERFLAGDGSAFATLVRSYQDNMMQFAASWLGAAGAEDAAQEIFLQAARSLPGFRGDSSFSTWLYSLARNVCRHRLRERHAAKRDAETAEECEAEALPDGSPELLSWLEREEASAVVRRAVDALPPGQRAVLVLSHWEGMRYEEIARVLDIPVGTVKSRMHGAMAALARELASACPGRTERNE